jgi:hypothetical protein
LRKATHDIYWVEVGVVAGDLLCAIKQAGFNPGTGRSIDPIVRELVQQPLMTNHVEGFAEIKENPVNLSCGIDCLGPVVY